MKPKLFLLIGLFVGITLTYSQNVSLSGIVREAGNNNPISGAQLRLLNSGLTATTDAQGSFSISAVLSVHKSDNFHPDLSFELKGNMLIVRSGNLSENTTVELYSTTGSLMYASNFEENSSSDFEIEIPDFKPGVSILLVKANGKSISQKLFRLGDNIFSQDYSSFEKGGSLKASAAFLAVDSLMISKTGYLDAKIGIDSYTMENLEITLESSNCDIPEMPSRTQLDINIPKLPNPFTFKIADYPDVTKREDWNCRREEINKAMQAYIYGENPAPEKVEANYSGNTLEITVSYGGKSISFDLDISGGDPQNPKPLLLKYGGFGSLPGLPNGIVSATMPINDIAADATSSSGLFYNLYGTNHSAGELAAWAWGVGRVIDALEMTPEVGIDPTKVAVHGCSRYGKGALAAGALEPRVALTIPEEAGSGGGSAWRIIAAEKSSGRDIQTLSSACSERNWMHQNFCDWSGLESRLPVDMHEAMGLVAPRGLLFLDGDAGNDWLGVTASSWSAHGTAEIYKALGSESGFTYSQINSSHCTTPQGQGKYVTAYMNYYLLGEGEPPEGGVVTQATRQFNRADWIDWETPSLE